MDHQDHLVVDVVYKHMFLILLGQLLDLDILERLYSMVLMVMDLMLFNKNGPHLTNVFHTLHHSVNSITIHGLIALTMDQKLMFQVLALI